MSFLRTLKSQVDFEESSPNSSRDIVSGANIGQAIIDCACERGARKSHLMTANGELKKENSAECGGTELNIDADTPQEVASQAFVADEGRSRPRAGDSLETLPKSTSSATTSMWSMHVTR